MATTRRSDQETIVFHLTDEQSKSRYAQINSALVSFGRMLDGENRLRINTKTTGELFIDLSACDVEGVIGTIAIQAYLAGRDDGKDRQRALFRELAGVE